MTAVEQPLQLLITNARIATDDPNRYNIGVCDGVIVSITRNDVETPAERTIDAGGRWVIPGAIDTHAHINQIAPEYADLPGFRPDDNFAMESRSAVAGGCTTALNYVHWSPKLLSAYRSDLALAAEQSRMNVFFHGYILNAGQIDDVAEAVKEGLTTFKLFMPYRGEEAQNLGGISSLNHAEMRVAFKTIKEAGAQALVHAEDGDIVDACMRAEAARGLDSLAGWERSRPTIAEGDAAWTAMYLAEEAGVDVTIVHVSSREAMRAREALGYDRAALESCIHYMVLNTDDEIGPEGKVAPPIRSAQLAEEITEAVLDGRIDFFGTDHNVWPAAAKEEWNTSKPGLPSIHLFLPLILTHFVYEKGMSMERAIELTSRNAALRFGLPTKGKVAVGMDADLVVLEEGEKVVRTDEMYTAIDYSPFEGMVLRAWPKATVIGGTVVFEDGSFPGDDFRGEMLNLRFAEAGEEALA